MDTPKHPGKVEFFKKYRDTREWFWYSEEVNNPPDPEFMAKIKEDWVPVIKIIYILDQDGYPDMIKKYGPNDICLESQDCARSNCPK